jgi:Leucine-rich repeat (LRR) protein
VAIAATGLFGELQAHASTAPTGPGETRSLRAPWKVDINVDGHFDDGVHVYLDDGVDVPGDRSLWLYDLCGESLLRDVAFVKWMNENGVGLVCNAVDAKALALGSKLARLASLDDNFKLKPISGLPDKPRPSAWFVGASTSFTDASLSGVPNGTTAVALTGTRVSDSGLAHLAGLHELVALSLDFAQPAANSGVGVITDGGLANLAPLSNLRWLHMSGVAISERGFGYLSGLVNLRFLSVTDAGQLNAQSLVHLGALRQLRTLSLKAAFDGPLPFNQLNELRSVDLSDASGPKDVAVENLEALVHLRSLNLSRARVTDEGLAHLKGLAELRTLRLEGAPITDAGLAQLAGLSSLRSLSLKRTAVTDEGLAHLRGLSGLRHLNLSGTGITEHGLVHLRGLRELRSLDLSSTRVGALKVLGHLPELRSVNLSTTHIRNEDLIYLSRLAHLRMIDVRWTDATFEGLKVLHKTRSLRDLFVGQIYDQNESVEKRRESVVKNLKKALPALLIHAEQHLSNGM